MYIAKLIRAGLLVCPLLIGISLGSARAQEVPTPLETGEDSTDVRLWDLDAVAKFSGSQASYQNWSKGGLNSLAATTGLEARAVREGRTWEQRHELYLSIGVIKQDTLKLRKADDEIRLHSSLGYKGNGVFRVLNPTVALQVRTQFAPGFNFKENPFRKRDPADRREPPIKVSDFLSPVTLTQSVGLAYEQGKWFRQRIGVGAKQTIVTIDRLRYIYGLRDTQVAEVELGVESRTQFDRALVENVRLKSSLGLFAAFNKPDLPDLQWENLIAMKVNSWFGVNLELDLLYDRDIGRALQVKEILSLGVSIHLI